MTNNGWSEYEKLVLNELERHNNLIEGIRKDVSDIRSEIAMLKVKSGLWGMLGATIPLAMAIGLKLIQV
jgi:hypothetical protein